MEARGSSLFQLTRLVPRVRPGALDDLGQHAPGAYGTDPYDGCDFKPVGQIRIDGWWDVIEFVRHEAWSNIVWSGNRRREQDYVRTLPFVVVDIDGLEDGWTEQTLSEHVRSKGCPALVITTKTKGRYRVLLRTERGMDGDEHRHMHSLYAEEIPGADPSCCDLTDWYRPCVRADNPDSGRLVLFVGQGKDLTVERGSDELSLVASAASPRPVYRHEDASCGYPTTTVQAAGQVADAVSYAMKAPPAVTREDRSTGRGTRNTQSFKVALTIAHKLFDTDSLDSFESVMAVYAARCTPVISQTEIRGMGRRIREYAFKGKGKFKPWKKSEPKKRLSPREAGIARAEGRRRAKEERQRRLAVVGGHDGTEAGDGRVPGIVQGPDAGGPVATHPPVSAGHEGRREAQGDGRHADGAGEEAGRPGPRRGPDQGDSGLHLKCGQCDGRGRPLEQRVHDRAHEDTSQEPAGPRGAKARGQAEDVPHRAPDEAGEGRQDHETLALGDRREDGGPVGPSRVPGRERQLGTRLRGALERGDDPGGVPSLSRAEGVPDAAVTGPCHAEFESVLRRIEALIEGG